MSKRHKNKAKPKPKKPKTQFFLPEEHLEAMLAHARSTPDEVCGILGGRNVSPTVREVHAVHRVKNAARFRGGSYVMDPQEQVNAFLAIDNAGLEFIGVYHSHPMSLSQLSGIDQREAERAGYTVSYVLLWPEYGSMHAKRAKHVWGKEPVRDAWLAARWPSVEAKDFEPEHVLVKTKAEATYVPMTSKPGPGWKAARSPWLGSSSLKLTWGRSRKASRHADDDALDDLRALAEGNWGWP